MNAIILAGGRGTRLHPFTKNFPKPLMPIGDIPILELLLRQLRRHGVSRVTVLSGHLAYLIAAYFGDGAALGLEIDYVRETEPLGTAGPLAQLRGRFNGAVFVLNGDLLTDLDFAALAQRHVDTHSSVTVAVYRRDEQVDLGVVSVDDDGAVVGYEEKPILNLDVSMGAYAISPEVFDAIPAGHYDMPQLIVDLLAERKAIAAYRHTGIWLDIGRPDDYEKANELFARDPAAFLGATET
jgi:NDP-sugar pyrophosphorylase family protein